MDINNMTIIFVCIISIIIISVVFMTSLWKLFKIILNSILGGILIYFINTIGVNFGLHIGLNAVTSIFVGVFGIPGAVLLLLLKII